jgi:hypothetical protein
MPDEISGMGKTNGNASLICKNICSSIKVKKCPLLLKVNDTTLENVTNIKVIGH